jgi:NADH:ubiquinone oxidoreductase subunit 4 (subunit M)
VPLMILILVIGFYPKLILGSTNDAVIDLVGNAYSVETAAATVEGS